MKIPLTIHFKNRAEEHRINLSLDYIGHDDDKKAIRIAAMKEVKQRWPNMAGYVQKVERKI